MALAARFGTSDSETQRTLGAACLRIGELDEAIDALQTALDLDADPTGRAITLALLILAHDLRGDRERALLARTGLRQITANSDRLDPVSQSLVDEAEERLETQERSTPKEEEKTR
jgi:Flp pilus assembly protein TadD